jgi:FixJ family two-component response regulator
LFFSFLLIIQSFRKKHFLPTVKETTLLNETKLTVYVVDDDASVRQALVLLLISAGMEVVTFKSAAECLEYELKEKDSCLITDIKMPRISGLELQQKLTERKIKIPVIFLTAFDSEEIRKQVKKLGAEGYFRKPVDDQALLDGILWAVSRSASSNS